MNTYDIWKTTNTRDDYDRPGCPCCDRIETKLEKNADHFKQALEILYSGKALGHNERQKLEECLDEVAYFFGLNLIPGDILTVYKC
jgi:hypothetical protein